MSETEFFPGGEDGEITTEALREIKEGEYKQASEETLEYAIENDISVNFMGFYQENDILNTALAAAGEKDGLMVRATLPNREPLETQIEAMNDLGLDCYLVPDTQEVDGREFDDSSVYVTNDKSYREVTDETLPFLDEKHEDHGGIGEFFGYPKEEVEAFEEHGMWPKGQTRTEEGYMAPTDYEEGTKYTFRPRFLARKHGREDAVDKMRRLIPYAIRDDEEVIEETIEKAESRYETLEDLEDEYGVEFTDLVG